MDVVKAFVRLGRSLPDQFGLMNRRLIQRSPLYARAQIARRGMRPSRAVVVTWEEFDAVAGIKHYTRVMRRDERDLRERLWRLVHGDAVTRDAVEAVLKETAP